MNDFIYWYFCKIPYYYIKNLRLNIHSILGCECLFFECSALTGINIKEVFTGLAENFLAKGVIAGAAEDKVNL